MKKYAPLLLALTFTGTLAAQDQGARVVTHIVTDTVPAWKTWKGDAGTMNYPGNWEAENLADGDTVVLFRQAGKEQLDTDPFVVLTVEEREAPSSPGQLMPPAGEGVTVLSTDGPDDTGYYTMEYECKVAGRVQHRLEHVKHRHGRAYILTFSASPESYGEQLFLAEAMMKSFTLPAKP